jgi:hypothetical protein
MKFPPKLLFYLQLFATIGQGITSGVVHLSGLVPAESLPYVTGWIGLLVFCAMSFLTLATGAVGVGSGPLARPPTVKEVQEVMDKAKENGK